MQPANLNIRMPSITTKIEPPKYRRAQNMRASLLFITALACFMSVPTWAFRTCDDPHCAKCSNDGTVCNACAQVRSQKRAVPHAPVS
jgi:hypothetical protein